MRSFALLVTLAGCSRTGLIVANDDLAADLGVPADMVAPADMVRPQGNIDITSVDATKFIAAGDGGATSAVRLLATNARFVPGPTAHDYNGFALGRSCVGDHFDMDSGDLGDPTFDSGALAISGFSGGTDIYGMSVPREIGCAFQNNFYSCGYGPVDADGGIGPHPEGVFYASDDPLRVGDLVRFRLAGGSLFGLLDATVTVPATLGIMVVEDLEQVKYAPTADTVIHFTCSGTPCDGRNVSLNLWAFGNGGNLPRWGGVYCSAPANAGQVVVEREAISAMLGCDAAGRNCDAALTDVQTDVTRTYSESRPDARGNPVRLNIGRAIRRYGKL